jgi:hypothetical protein
VPVRRSRFPFESRSKLARPRPILEAGAAAEEVVLDVGLVPQVIGHLGEEASHVVVVARDVRLASRHLVHLHHVAEGIDLALSHVPVRIGRRQEAAVVGDAGGAGASGQCPADGPAQHVVGEDGGLGRLARVVGRVQAHGAPQRVVHSLL